MLGTLSFDLLLQIHPVKLIFKMCQFSCLFFSLVHLGQEFSTSAQSIHNSVTSPDSRTSPLKMEHSVRGKKLRRHLRFRSLYCDRLNLIMLKPLCMHSFMCIIKLLFMVDRVGKKRQPKSVPMIGVNICLCSSQGMYEICRRFLIDL